MWKDIKKCGPSIITDHQPDLGMSLINKCIVTERLQILSKEFVNIYAK